MQILKTLTLCSLALCAAGTAQSANFDDPTWPCVQRKVETLSLGLMWPHPVSDDYDPGVEGFAAEVDQLSELLSLRRVELDDLRPDVEKFAAKYDGDVESLGVVFDKTFKTLSKRRTRIIGGIGTFSLGQIELAQKIDTARLEMDQLLAKDAPDFDKIDDLEEQIDWDQVIHSDRQRSIQYLCETPQLIERRLFAISQMLQQVSQ